MNQNYNGIRMQIEELKKKEQTEEIVEEIKLLEIKYYKAKKVSDEVLSLNEEMRNLLFGEISL